MLEALREIINPQVLIGFDTDKKTLSLKEDGADSKISKLYITHIPEEIVAFTLDYAPGGKENRWFKQLSPYINAGNGIGVNMGCDLVLLWHKDGKKIALIFDLKSDRFHPESTRKQLANSELYVRYLLSMVATHYGVDVSDVEIKKTVGTTKARSPNKTATYRPNSKPSQFDNYHIEAISANKDRTGHVSLQKLAR
jgi:hypothetical protein